MSARNNGHPNTHLVLIPSYNTGPKIFETIAAARKHWPSILVVVDGSTDGTDAALASMFQNHPGISILHRRHNGGKGAAILDGLRHATSQNFTHVLTMDADGQHPAPAIPNFMAASRNHPRAMILGVPIFDHTAPPIRVLGHKISNILTRLETQAAIGDSLFGFRVYPIAPLLAIMTATRRMRRFDFDTEAVVRLSWRGVAALNLPAPVRYFRTDEGGVSQFQYGRDNLLLACMHLRLLARSFIRLPRRAARQAVLF